ncbi:zinc metalloproteinase [Stemphylium lycopersici]|uniref:Zinc metalloproteinase n=1 Tax=Stemphylium lycopersici TaxID=183478 RepID=A0A364N1W6_STELY|nr:zinc metalloproteinase [Stemphylium lycopersici]
MVDVPKTAVVYDDETSEPVPLLDDAPEASRKNGTRSDVLSMWRLGKKQEFLRNFKFISIFGFSMILMSSWEIMLGTSSMALFDGGKAGMIWMNFIVWVGFLGVNVSLAEMGSMAPTSGGQYHWVSEFAPAKYQKFISYMTGWLSVLGWQTASAATAFQAGTQIQGLIALNRPEYIFEPWHGTLLVFAVAVFNLVFNIFFIKKLPLIESVMLFVHIFGFIAIMAVLWATGPISNAKDSFTHFNDYGGWSSDGLATLTGIVAAVVPLIGADAAVHLAEEVRDASKIVPLSMIWTTLANGTMSFVMAVTFCFVLGDIDAALETPTKQAYIYVFYSTTGSVVGASLMSALVILVTILCNISITTTSSRQLFAFARDKGVPFHQTFARVSPSYHVPIPAIILSCLTSCLLSLINLGSSVALQNINSLSTGAAITSYIISISCIVLRRIRGEALLPSKFSLGRAGLALNVLSLMFLTVVLFFSFWPLEKNPTAEAMNWSCVIYVVAIVGSLGYYWGWGREVRINEYLVMVPVTHPLRITNLEDGETIHQRCLLVTGTYALDAAEGSYIHVATKGANKVECFPEQTWPLAGGNFKAMVMLSPGLNILEFAYVCDDCLEHTVEISVNHLPLLQYPPIHLAIMVACDSPCFIDCPTTKAGGISSAHSDLDAAIAKLRMTAYMWQAMTAEDLRLQGVGRRSFRFDEEWTADTVSREFINARMDRSLAQDGAMRSTAKIHIIRSSKTVKDIRSADIAQQNGYGRQKNKLFNYFNDALKKTGGPFVSEARPVVAGLILDSHYSVSKELILGHAALGLHNPDGISLGIFGSHLTYSWPRFLEEVTSCLTDIRSPGDKVGNDNGECTTMWEACAIGQGAHLHEIGHAFGSPHRSGIMQRGYARDWPKNFLSKTAYSGYLEKDGELVGLPNHNARWDLADALSFRMLPHFRLPADSILTEEEQKENPDVQISYDNDSSPATLHVSSSSGIARIIFNRFEHCQPLGWIHNAPKAIQYSEAELDSRFSRNSPLSLQVLGLNSRELYIADVWKLLATRSFIRIPNSNIRLIKRLAFSSEAATHHAAQEPYTWAQLLREKGADGTLHRAVSIDLRVGAGWDGGVVKYADGHVSHWGPMRHNGSTHRFGGHASEEIDLPDGVEISSLRVKPHSGVRLHLSNGQSAGHLNARRGEQDVVEVKPAPDEVVVGFFGKSKRDDGWCCVCEFGLICVKREIGWEGLPEQVWELSEVRNLAGLDGDADDREGRGGGDEEDYDDMDEAGE